MKEPKFFFSNSQYLVNIVQIAQVQQVFLWWTGDSAETRDLCTAEGAGVTHKRSEFCSVCPHSFNKESVVLKGLSLTLIAYWQLTIRLFHIEKYGPLFCSTSSTKSNESWKRIDLLLVSVFLTLFLILHPSSFLHVPPSQIDSSELIRSRELVACSLSTLRASLPPNTVYIYQPLQQDPMLPSCTPGTFTVCSQILGNVKDIEWRLKLVISAWGYRIIYGGPQGFYK